MYSMLNCGKLAKYEHIWCGRKFVLELFFTLQLSRAAVMCDKIKQVLHGQYAQYAQGLVFASASQR